jgi:NTP pyrophosphatase (non-canonical NTP hydrolase)
VSDLQELRDRMREFTDERDWARFHDPKSLILALLGELGELAELFQWLPAEEARTLGTQQPMSCSTSCVSPMCSTSTWRRRRG